MENMEKQKDNFDKFVKYLSCGLATIMIGILGYAIHLSTPVFRALKEHRHAIKHLDSYAVPVREVPEYLGRTTTQGVTYEDTDKDGDYESIFIRENSNGDVIKMPIIKGLEGKINFPNLSETAVSPLNLPNKPHDLEVDYVHKLKTTFFRLW